MIRIEIGKTRGRGSYSAALAWEGTVYEQPAQISLGGGAQGTNPPYHVACITWAEFNIVLYGVDLRDVVTRDPAAAVKTALERVKLAHWREALQQAQTHGYQKGREDAQREMREALGIKSYLA